MAEQARAEAPGAEATGQAHTRPSKWCMHTASRALLLRHAVLAPDGAWQRHVPGPFAPAMPSSPSCKTLTEWAGGPPFMLVPRQLLRLPQAQPGSSPLGYLLVDSFVHFCLLMPLPYASDSVPASGTGASCASLRAPPARCSRCRIMSASACRLGGQGVGRAEGRHRLGRLQAVRAAWAWQPVGSNGHHVGSNGKLT